MKSGDIFKDNNPHWVQPGVHFVQTICGTCRKPISFQTYDHINGVASCYYCHNDHNISKNVCDRPYCLPKPRKLIDRSDQNIPVEELLKRGMGQATSSITTIAATQAFLKNPHGGL